MKAPKTGTELRPWRGLIWLLVAWLGISTASANPINLTPGAEFLSLAYLGILFICIVFEVSFVSIFSVVFHDVCIEISAKFLLVVLNVLTLIFVAVPVYRYAESILIAEVLVILVEAVGISKILEIEGVRLSFKRAAIYSLIANFVTWAVGAMTL
jgi:hypothetical protein